MASKYVVGDTALISKLNALKKTHAKSAIRKGSREGTKIIAARAKSLAPVVSGQMKAAIKVRALPRSTKYVGTEVKVDNEQAYYYSFVEFGTKRSKAVNFLKDAADDTKGEAVDKAIDVIKNEIEKRMK